MKSNLDIIKRNKLPVVIYGAGSIGKLLKDKIEKLGIRVRYFCDDTDEKWGNKFCDIDVVGINFLKDTGKDYLFIISLRFMNSLIAELEKLGFNNHFAGGVLITNDDIAKETEGIEKERLGLCKVYHDSASMYGKSSIHNVDIMITEKCSLKCVDCSNLMQYYIKPEGVGHESLHHDIDKLCDIFDEISEVRIIGGEPFMNKEIHLITEKLVQKTSIRWVSVYTNGTIVPSDKQINYFQNKKIIFRISNYGELSRNLNRLTNKLEEYQIDYRVEDVDGWLDCAKIEKQEREIEENINLFKVCCGKDLPTLLKGKIYICPFIANGENLNALPIETDDSIDIHDPTLTKIQIRERIWEFLYNKTYFRGCDWCLGRPKYGGEKIPHALQTKTILPYELIR